MEKKNFFLFLAYLVLCYFLYCGLRKIVLAMKHLYKVLLIIFIISLVLLQVLKNI